MYLGFRRIYIFILDHQGLSLFFELFTCFY